MCMDLRRHAAERSNFKRDIVGEELHLSRVALQLITLLLEVCLKSGLNLIWGAEEKRVLKMISIPYHTCPVGISSFA